MRGEPTLSIRGEQRVGAVQRVRALAKLTLSLRVVGVRADGFHLVESEMVTLDLADELEFSEGDGLEIVGNGAVLQEVSDGDDNLIRRALRVAGRTAYVRLYKRIPVGGGLGGGSADAAAVLRWAGVRDLDLAASLGADVPMCLVGGRAFVTGIGERVQPLPFEERSFTLLTPPFSVSTPAVYRAWDELGGPRADGPNDLEPAALKVEPRLAAWQDVLGDASGRTPILAGSGSTWFVPGTFEGPGFVQTRSDRP
ncbi:MAG: 4-(cytidine 5'-diphospho)-2-C-methyl-D-erythritol kinase [Actinomycetota bacterium]|nr:4-(cytidine 5'-diphospho)-2-C-methyl-D-erythritol kinase [Actinomycetota bacterium]